MVETSNTLLLLRPASDAESSTGAAAAGGEPNMIIEGALGGTHELRRVVAFVDRVREILSGEQWADASGALISGSGARARSAPMPVAGAAAPARVAVAAPPDSSDEDEGARVARGMDESEEASAALAAGFAEFSSGARDRVADTMVVDLETEEAAVAREAALASLPFIPGPFDAELPRPRTGRGWTFDELSHVVRASRAEIAAELRRLHACIVVPGGDRFVVLADRYIASVLSDICTAAAAEGWPPEAIPLGALIHALDQHPAAVVETVARAHADEVGEGGRAGSMGVTLRLNPQSVAKRQAHVLLAIARADAEMRGGVPQNAPHTYWPVLHAAWAKAVERTWPPGGAAALAADALTVALLRDCVLIDSSTAATTGAGVRYFPEDELSANPPERFKQLFAARATWQEADLYPFLERLSAPFRKLTDMVATFCRVTISDDKTRTFSKK